MARNRHKKSHLKAPSPDLKRPAGKTSPAAQIIVNRIIDGGVEYWMENLITIMTDSVKLAGEPEFIDLTLNTKKTAEITQHMLKKNEKRLIAAGKKGQQEAEAVADEIQIEIIAELATPPFRKDVKRRLQALLDRIMANDDLEKLEMILILQPLLGMKDIPWGLCGLVVEIYIRTLKPVAQQVEEEQEILDALARVYKGEGEESFDNPKIMESPEKLDQVAQKLLDENPGLVQIAQKRALDSVDAFENKLALGKIALDLFTEEELLLPFNRLQKEFGMAITEMQPNPEKQKRTFDLIEQTITGIMTPERLQRMREDVESTAKVWMVKQPKWATALQLELDWLEGETYEQNKFVTSAFLGQIYRWGKG